MSQKWSLGNRKANTVENNLNLESIAQKIINLLENEGDDSTSENLMIWTSGWSAWKNYSEVSVICEKIEELKTKIEETPPPLDFSSAPPLLPASAPKVFNNTPSDKKQAHKEKVHLITDKKTTHSPPVAATHALISNPNPTTPAPVPANNHTTSKGNGALAKKSPLPYPKRKHSRVFARFKCIIRSSSLTFRTFTHDISLGGVSLEDEIPADLIGVECMIYISSTKTHKHLKLRIAPTERCVAKYFSFQDADQLILKELSDWIDDHQKMNAAS